MNQTRLLELAGVLATALGHLLLAGKPFLHPLYLAVTIGSWTAYLWYSVQARPDEVAAWGFRRASFAETSAWIVPLLALAASVMALVGVALGTFTLSWQFWVCLAIYPMWGWVQQWLVQGVVVRFLDEQGMQAATIVFVAAVAFSIAHWPDYALMLPTLALGFVFTQIYLRTRNLWPLGLAHGWLGAMLYYWVLGRDPISDLLPLAIG